MTRHQWTALAALLIGVAPATLVSCRTEERGPPRAQTVPNIDAAIVETKPSSSGLSSSGSSGSSGDYEPSPTSAERPSPTVLGTCQSTCATLEVTGIQTSLATPVGATQAAAAIAHTNNGWYVSWGGVPAFTTWVQHFSVDGLADGTTKTIPDLTPEGLIYRPEGELVLLGRRPPFATARGDAHTIHRFDASLAPIGAPLLLRGPIANVTKSTLEARASGAVAMVQSSARGIPLLRDIEVTPASGTSQTPVQRDWFLPASTASSPPEVVTIGGQRLVAYHDDSMINVARLEVNGLRTGVNGVVFADQSTPTSVRIWSRVIGGEWWVGAAIGRLNGAGYTVTLQRVTPETHAPSGVPIRLTWRTGAPLDLIDANGSPMLVGNLEPFEENARPAFVPIDVTQTAACRSTVLRVNLDAERRQSLAALQFAGDTAAAVVETSGLDQRLYFTRLRCRP